MSSLHVVEALFSRPRKKTLAAAIIDIFTKKWLENTDLKNRVPTHTAILIDGRRVVEAVPFKGVVFVPFDKWIEKNEIVWSGCCTLGGEHLEKLIDRSALFESLRFVHESKYDWVGAIMAGIRSLLFSLTGKKYNVFRSSIVNNREKYYCVEVLFLFFADILMKYLDSIDDISVLSPAELLHNITQQKS